MSEIVLAHPLVERTKESGTEISRIERVTVRRAKALDIAMMMNETGAGSQALALIASLTGLTRSQVENLDVDDFRALAQAVEGFM